MFRQRNITICREGVYYLAVVAFVATGALMRDINLLLVVAGMLIGPLLYNWRSVVVSLRGLEVRRKVPKSISAGDLLVVGLELANTRAKRSSWAVAVEDELERENGARRQRSRVGVLFAEVPAGQTRHRTYTGRLMQRGRYRFRRLLLSTRFPLGLFRCRVALEAEQWITVYPRRGRMTGTWRRLNQDVALGNQVVRHRHGALEGDFFGLRDWRPGDSRRWIHWRTSARRSSLVVRQFEEQRNEDLLLMVDLWQPKKPAAEDLERVERAVSFAATAVAELCRRGGSQVALGLAGRDVEWIQGAASMAILSEALDELAVVEAGADDRLGQLVRRGLEQTRTGAKTVILSTRPVDLADNQRWADLPDDLRRQLALRRIVTIDVGSEQMADYFEMV